MDRLPKEHPILFSAPMVKAILGGTKTQTRRVVRPGPSQEWLTPKTIDMVRRWANGGSSEWWTMAVGDESRIVHCGHEMDGGHIGSVRCPYGAPGDRLWVRETWGCPSADHPLCKGGRKPADGDKIVYLANDADAYQWDRPGHPGIGDFVWRPSIHMPRWASRITLEITEVRVQRVAEISEEDATSEGTQEPSLCALGGMLAQAAWSERQVFQRLWDSINEKRGFGWAANPWVWCISFRPISSQEPR